MSFESMLTRVAVGGTQWQVQRDRPAMTHGPITAYVRKVRRSVLSPGAATFVTNDSLELHVRQGADVLQNDVLVSVKEPDRQVQVMSIDGDEMRPGWLVGIVE